ncbi:MAG TPA: ATP-binding protein [Candidatus Limnocylindrales bacterium]|nr:ATP-binding protein [Candidatus Limnocylindrales bacterium]
MNSSVDLELVLANMLEGVVVFSEETASFVNQAAEAMLGRSRRALLGQRASDIFARSAWIGGVLDRIDHEHPALREEGELDAAGARKPVVAEAVLIRDRDDIAFGRLLVLYDLSRRGPLQHQDRDRQRVAELDRLAAQFAHEINNPLSGIRGAAQLLSRRLSDRADLCEYTEMIVRQADRMKELVEALMALEAPLLKREPVNIHRILNDLLLLQRPASEQRGVALEAEFDPSLPDVRGDAGRLEQLFLNILSNALSVCPSPGGRVRLTTRMEHSFYVEREGGRVHFLTVSIADNGPGLDAEALEHMFSPLFSRRKGGHGMGLAIASAIAAAHDGRIRAENGPDGGAVFHVTLPVVTGREGAKAAAT